MSMCHQYTQVPPRVQQIRLDHNNIPLPPRCYPTRPMGRLPLSDATPPRVTAKDRLEGLGYSYVVGNIGGSAVHSMLRDDLVPWLVQTEPAAIQTLWDRMG